MKILVISPPFADILSPGGIYKVIKETAKHLSALTHNVLILQPNIYDLPEEENYEGFRIVRINTFFKNKAYGFQPEAYWFLKQNLANINPDIVHVHGYHSLLSPLVIHAVKKFLPSVPIVFSPHLDTHRSTWAGRYLWNLYNNVFGKKIFLSVDQIISPSEYEAQMIMQIFNIPENEITIIPHGVDRLDNTPRLKENKYMQLLYVGYFVERKGIEYVVQVLEKLVHRFGVKEIKLIMVGNGPLKKRIFEKLENLGLTRYVTWKNNLPRQKLLELIKNSDVLLLLSKSEAYGIVVAEALALGTPTIVTKRTALKEFVSEPGCFGVEFPPDPKEVAELILKIINNKVKVGPFSKKIRTWEKVTKDYERIYMQTIQQRKENG